MTPKPLENSLPPVNLDPRLTELSKHSDEVLLRHVIKIEGNEEANFPGLYQDRFPSGGGKYWSSPGDTVTDFSIEEMFAQGNSERWHDVYEAYCDIAVRSWDVTWESCRTASFTSMLKSTEAAYCLALIAWHRCGKDASESMGPTVQQKLERLSPDARREALESFGRGGAISSAYEGVRIDPAALAK